MSDRPSYDELRKRYDVGDIVYWGRRVLGFEKNDPMTCPNCDPINKRIAELTAQRDRLREEVASPWIDTIHEKQNLLSWIEETSEYLQSGDMTGA